MFFPNRRLRSAIVAGTVGTALALGSAASFAADPSAQEMAEQLKALQAKVDQMQAKQDALDKANAQATANRVEDDASRHDKMLDVDAFTGGWDPKKLQFFIGTEDGNFYLHPGVIFQFRYVANYRDAGKKSGDSQWTNGFEVRRAKFVFDGNVFSPDLTYKFQWQDGNNGGSPTLEYGWGQYVFMKDVVGGGNLALKAGQYKDPVYKEEFTSDTNQLMIERSLANDLVGGVSTGPLIQGVDLLYTGNKTPVHADLVFHDGVNSGNTDFTNNRDITTAPIPTATNFGITGRVDYKVFGDWADTTDLTGKNSGQHDLLDLGAAFDYTDLQGSRDLHWAVDAQYQIAHKLALYTGLFGNDLDFRNVKTGAPTGRDDIAGVIEGGYSLTPVWQLVARYSIVRASDSFKTTGQGTFNEIAGGVNYFMGPDGTWGNHAKLSLDLTYLPNGTPAATGLDYLATAEDKAELVLRSQFQLSF
jgi:hypothetical protein